MTERACENCGTPDDELLLVRRVYIQPETWDQAASETVVAEAGTVVRLVLLAVPARLGRRATRTSPLTTTSEALRSRS